jgi:DNA mismatch endonuclease (patch repair protein)
MPTSNQEYWEAKIFRNVTRDKKYRRELHRRGWHYVTIWECNVQEGIARTVKKAKELGVLT